MPLPHLRGLEAQLRACGLSRACLGLRAEFVKSLKGASLLGVQQNWPEVRRVTEILLSLSGFEIPLPNGADFHLPYRLLVDGTLFQFLTAKRVFLVGALAPELARRWGESGFVEAHRGFGPMGRARIAGAFGTAGRERGAWRDLDAAARAAEAADFDVALLACGAPAKILARRIWETGRTALDVGFAYDALLGNRERLQRAVLREAQWPPDRVEGP